MFAIIVTEKGGEQRRLEFDKSEVTIGRVQGNDVILPKGNVSKRHARIVLKDGKFIIVDLKSTNGTYVNGRKITSPLVVKESDKIYIGDFIMGVEDAGARMPDAPPPPAAPAPSPSPAPSSGPNAMGGGGGYPSPPGPPPPAPAPRPPAPSAPAPAPHRPPAPPLAAPSPAPAPAAAPPMPEPLPAPGAQARPRVPAPGPGPLPAPRPVDKEPSAPAPAPQADRRSEPRLVGSGAVPRPSAPPASAAPSAAPAPQSTAPAPRPMPRQLDRGVRVAAPSEEDARRLDAQRTVLARLIPRLDIDAVPAERLREAEFGSQAQSAAADLIKTMAAAGELPEGVDHDALGREVLGEALGLGPLDGLLADDAVEEVIVDRHDRVLVRKGGSLGPAGCAFSSPEAVRRTVERLAASAGHSVSESAPVIDVRLRDGAQLTAAVPPVAVHGACFTLRKPSSAAQTPSLTSLVSDQAMSQPMADFLELCVSARRNLLVCGAGAEELVAALAAASPEGERIVSVEEVSALKLERSEWIALETRVGDGNGRSAVNLKTLLHSALRLRADRLVVGDLRGAEAYDLFGAMSAMADGTIVRAGGDGAWVALQRLAALAQTGAGGATAESVRQLMACAVDVVVHVARYADGVTRVAAISELAGAHGDSFDVRELFAFRGADSGFSAAGVVPTFFDDMAALGLSADAAMFRA
ncbi:ATPase, T2SS/T4P/T4SS family [Haliangium ochraceum]|uniref:FHA domain containing protein n=1 Tax=Haliangium ochraceum (strain DSM 14365 / JCM 11303 / SMP-2) TaxID=502025 RepID=D0LW34_HALO1|nr:ATPase, T2SS/T4P/T4SS family [Haliangium ochraceum]ACY15966.1 FHA domain containing protein [Haliangium ochraceum DSM 14365]